MYASLVPCNIPRGSSTNRPHRQPPYRKRTSSCSVDVPILRMRCHLAASFALRVWLLAAFVAAAAAATLAFGNVAVAHPGDTDAYGGHTCRTNCASWGLGYNEYHTHGSTYRPRAPSGTTPKLAPVTPTQPRSVRSDSGSNEFGIFAVAIIAGAGGVGLIVFLGWLVSDHWDSK